MIFSPKFPHVIYSIILLSILLSLIQIFSPHLIEELKTEKYLLIKEKDYIHEACLVKRLLSKELELMIRIQILEKPIAFLFVFMLFGIA